MQVEFHGAAGEVTGSMHLVVAVGSREAEVRNRIPFLEPVRFDALVISHAYIDHIGRVLLLAKRGADCSRMPTSAA